MSKYIPTNDSAFCDWAEKVSAYATANCARWGVSAPGNELESRLSDLKDKVDKCKLPTRSKVDTLAKNQARKTVEKDFRNYLQGLVMRNIKVTGEDRKMMGLPIYDATPTPVGDPVGLVTATVKYPNEGALELHIKHVTGSPFDKRANYGVKIRSGIFPIDQPPANHANQLTESRFTRRKKELFTFDKNDRKKIACFCLRYENAKGKAGQWSSVISAVVP